MSLCIAFSALCCKFGAFVTDWCVIFACFQQGWKRKEDRKKGRRRSKKKGEERKMQEMKEKRPRRRKRK